MAAADFSNGISWIVSWDDWLFVNTDLTVHLHRDPVGEWIGLDARTALEPKGSGLAVADLHDERRPGGVSLKSLFVAPRKPGGMAEGFEEIADQLDGCITRP